MTPKEYLELERKAEYKSEYYNGEIFAMSGANRYHDRIATRLLLLIFEHIQGKKFVGHTSNVRLLMPPNAYTYADLSVSCKKPLYQDAEEDALLNPTLIVEIVSPQTEDRDRGTKPRLYRSMPSVDEFLLVAQDEFDVELYRRHDDEHWDLFHAAGLDASVELTSIACTLTLREIYENVLTAE